MYITCNCYWGPSSNKLFEFFQRLTVRHRGKEAEDEAALSPRQKLRERISKRAALEFHDGMYGILGILFDM